MLRSTVLTEQHYREALEDDGVGYLLEQDGEVTGFTLGNATTGNIWALFVDPRFEALPGEQIQEGMLRFRTLGCWPLTGGISTGRFWRNIPTIRPA